MAAPVELVASSLRVGVSWRYDDADVSQICGSAVGAFRAPAAPDGVVQSTAAGAAMATPVGVAPRSAARLRSLTIALGTLATDAAVASLATLPVLATLRSSLACAVAVRLPQ